MTTEAKKPAALRWGRWLPVALALLALAGLAGITWRLWPERRTFYTDADTIRDPAGEAPLREILWQPPKLLPLPINTALEEYEPRVSADGLTLFFVRGKAGQNADVYTASRTRDGWSEPQPIDAINSDADELGPEPSVDGNQLFFYSNREGGLGGYDLWVARRSDDGWTAPSNLGQSINSSYNEYGPAASPDGRLLYFSSNRPRPDDRRQPNPDAWPATLREELFHRDYDLYVATVESGEPGQAIALTALNSPYNEGTPAVSPVGDFLYFASDRPGGAGGFDLYRSRRLRGGHEKPESLKLPVNTPANELDPGLSMGGFGLSFSSDRPLADASAHDCHNYNLYHTNSREVFREVEVSQAPPIDWAAFWNIFGPSLLWALLALLLALLLWLLLGQMRSRKLDLLTKCLLASLFAHLLLMMLFTLWQVAAALPGEFRRGGAIQVALIPSTGAGEITSQVLGSMTSVDTPSLLAVPIGRPEMQVEMDAKPAAAIVDAPPMRIHQSSPLEAADAADVQVDASQTVLQLEAGTVVDASGLRLHMPVPRDSQPVQVAESALTIEAAPARPLVRPPPEQFRQATASRSVEVSTPSASSRLADETSSTIQPAVYAFDAGASPPTAVPARVQETVRPPLPAIATLTLPEDASAVRRHVQEAANPLPGLIAAPTAQGIRAAPIPEPAASTAPARLVDSSVAPSSQRERAYESLVDSGDTSAPDAPVVDRAAVSFGRDVTSPRLDRSAFTLPPLEERRSAATETTSLPYVAGAVANQSRPAVEPSSTPPANPVLVHPGVVSEQRLGRSHAPSSPTVADSSAPAVAHGAPPGSRVAVPRTPAANTSVVLPTEAAHQPHPVVAEALASPPPAKELSVAPGNRPPVAPEARPSARSAPLATVSPARLTDASLGQAQAKSPLPSPRDSAPAGALLTSSREPVTPRLLTEIPGLRLPSETEPPKSMFPQRAVEQRRNLVEQHGGSEKTEEAVAAALKWLADHQSPGGAWEGDNFDERCGECGGETEAQVDIGLTGLSLLCFLGADHNHVEDGPYRQTVQRAVDWLLSQQQSDGNLLGQETMYSHGIATIALAEAYGITREQRLREPVKKAIDFIHAARSSAGGWRYEPGQPGDTSVAGWQLMALRSARQAGIEVSAEGFEHARRWLDRVSRPSKPGLYSYQPGREFTPAMTAEGMFMQQVLGLGRDDPRIRGSVNFILKNLPDWEESPNTYYWYYATLAMFQQGGNDWRRWNERLVPQLLGHQHKSGRKSGSWDPEGEWAGVGGRVYQTALCALMLEVYYRYLPLYLQAQPADAIGTIRGHVVDASTGRPMAGVTVRVDVADGAPSAATTDPAGAYTLAVPPVPPHFAVSASFPRYVPQAVNVAEADVRATTFIQDFQLQRQSDDVIAIEAVPEVHHLGDNRFEGRINSQFQKKSEGDYYFADFELAESPAAGKFRRAELLLLAKGVQRPHEIRINGTRLEDKLDDAPSDGSFGEFTADIPIGLLRRGSNTFELFAKKLGDDIDDFEFVNVQVRLLP